METKKTMYAFGSSEFKQAIADLTKKGTILDPAKEIKKFKKIVEDRGYNYFSSESMTDWRKVYGGITYKQIVDKANEDVDQFIHATKTVGHPDHNENRILFSEQFNTNENAVRTFFLNARKEEAGDCFMPAKDQSYESRVIGSARIETKHQQFEHETMKQLFLAKWAALGYYKDADYKQRFFDEYSIALNNNQSGTQNIDRIQTIIR